MNKKILFIIGIIIIISALVACSGNNSSIEITSTTAVTDIEGQTHYYESVINENGETVTDKEGNTVLSEIETDTYGKAVTEKDGRYVTNEYTTVLAIESLTEKSSITEKVLSDTTKDITDADNHIEFETSADDTTKTTTITQANTTTQKATTTTTQKQTQPATDQDGWINKWY
ncbi:MAG: hypothetical protein ACI4IG_01925 [Eubacterium sp.]